MTNRVRDLLQAIETTHGCKAAHERSAVVMEQFRGQLIWDGVVEVFTLTGHPKARRCYAWSLEEDGQPRSVTILELLPVDSPSTAVQAAIAGGQQK